MRTQAVSLLLALSAGCAPQTAAEATPPVPVRLSPVTAVPARCSLTVTGMLRANRSVALSFNVGGYVTAIARRGNRTIEVGDPVRRGELLAAVRQTDYGERSAERASLAAQALASRTQAVLDEGRAARLLASGAISRSEYDSASNRLEATRAAAEAAEAGRRGADISLSDTRLIAPFDATLLARNVEQVALVAAGTVAYVLGSLGTMRVDVAVPDSVASQLAPGAEVPFRVAGSSERRTAQVLTLSPRVDARTRLIPVELVTQNRDGALRDGRPTHVEFPNACLAGDAVVPVESLVRASGDKGLPSVWVTRAERGLAKAERREVEVVGLVEASVVVKGKLSPGERVVTMGATHVSDAVDIEVLP
jgi:RND family efflux transporter MFP subunit